MLNNAKATPEIFHSTRATQEKSNNTAAAANEMLNMATLGNSNTTDV